MIVVLFGFCVVMLIWATVSEVDVVATATGRLIPSERIKQVQPSEDGVVHKILVEEGARVSAGQPVVVLDSTALEADVRRLDVEIRNARLSRLRLIAALEGRDDFDLSRPAESASSEAAVQLAYLRTLIQQYRAGQARMKGELDFARAELASARTRRRMLVEVLSLHEERYNGAGRLFQNGAISRNSYLTVRAELLRTRQDHDAQEQLIARSHARIESVEQERQHLHAEFRNGLSRERLAVEERIATLEQDIVKARRRLELMTLRAPVDGTVQELTIFTEGGVVTAGQPIMSVVPAGSTLIVEARLLNKDIGFVRRRQSVSVKLAAFPFTRYGDIKGWVNGISEDVLNRDRQPPAISLGDDVGTRQALVDLQAQMAGNNYLVHVTLDSQVMPVPGGTAPLAAGMIATIDIATGRRRVIDFLLSPLKRYRAESLRER